MRNVCVRLDDQLDEEIEGFVDDFLSPGVLTIDLIDHDDRARIEFERFA